MFLQNLNGVFSLCLCLNDSPLCVYTIGGKSCNGFRLSVSDFVLFCLIVFYFFIFIFSKFEFWRSAVCTCVLSIYLKIVHKSGFRHWHACCTKSKFNEKQVHYITYIHSFYLVPTLFRWPKLRETCIRVLLVSLGSHCNRSNKYGSLNKRFGV